MMHAEIQVALKFVISFLYNKLPRRRVNLFGEELENALKDKFQGHWYPDKPFKGSAYRCLKITDPSDPVLNRAARESGNPISDIIENLPADLAVWIDPGEVSYRMGEKGAVKILYSEKDNSINMEDISPEVRGFLALDTVTASLNGLSLSQGGYGGSSPLNGPISPPLPPQIPGPPQNPSSSPGPSFAANPFQPRQPPVVYTAATFAQTKFGSTKLKTNSKKPNRMSPTEFSNYIKQRAMQKSLQLNGPFGQQNVSQGHQQQQQQNMYDKFYQNGFGQQQQQNANNYNYGKTSNGPTDFGFGLGGPPGQNGGLSSSGSFAADYSSFLSEWSDVDLDANAFLQDILSSAAAPKSQNNRQLNGYDDWLGPGVGLGLNANQFPDAQLGPDSRSSSTKSMSSGSESLPSSGQSSTEGFSQQQRVLVAN